MIMMSSASFSRTWRLLWTLFTSAARARRAQNDVADGRFAAGVAVAVEQGEEERQTPPCCRSPARKTRSQGTKQLSKIM